MHYRYFLRFVIEKNLYYKQPRHWSQPSVEMLYCLCSCCLLGITSYISWLTLNRLLISRFIPQLFCVYVPLFIIVRAENLCHSFESTVYSGIRTTRPTKLKNTSEILSSTSIGNITRTCSVLAPYTTDGGQPTPVLVIHKNVFHLVLFQKVPQIEFRI